MERNAPDEREREGLTSVEAFRHVVTFAMSADGFRVRDVRWLVRQNGRGFQRYQSFAHRRRVVALRALVRRGDRAAVVRRQPREMAQRWRGELAGLSTRFGRPIAARNSNTEVQYRTILSFAHALEIGERFDHGFGVEFVVQRVEERLVRRVSGGVRHG